MRHVLTTMVLGALLGSGAAYAQVPGASQPTDFATASSEADRLLGEITAVLTDLSRERDEAQQSDGALYACLTPYVSQVQAQATLAQSNRDRMDSSQSDEVALGSYLSLVQSAHTSVELYEQQAAQECTSSAAAFAAGDQTRSSTTGDQFATSDTTSTGSATSAQGGTQDDDSDSVDTPRQP